MLSGLQRAINNDQLTMSDTQEFEKCVLCGVVTDVLVDDPVEDRQWYVPGVGQLCLGCAETGFTDLGSKLKQLRIKNDGI